VPIASLVAISSLKPSFIPDLIIDSTKLKKYAGPEPLNAVTASCCDSSTSTTNPVFSSSALVNSKSFLLEFAPAEITDTPLPT
jgi:hypothetical protein